MKRLCLLICLMCSLCSIAQQHMKFMGIPIDGTISEFQKKLETKGWKQNIEKSRKAEIGERWFDGIFFGENASMSVDYDPHTKVVYECSSYIFTDKEHINDLFKNILSGIKEKYKDNILISKEDELKGTFWIHGYDILMLGFIFIDARCKDLENLSIKISYLDFESLTQEEKNRYRKYDDL